MSPRRPRIAVAMSGGVDSSVAAALALDTGCDVVGITALLRSCDADPSPSERRGRPCCAAGVEVAASRVAQALGIEHVVVDARDDFLGKVIEPTREAQERGLTPNPCILCNEHVKFGLLLERANGMGATSLWTGHYARIRPGEGTVSGNRALARGSDPERDQSYFLFTIVGDGRLDRVEFPIGEMDKGRVRALASKLGLPSASTPASQDLCFPPAPGRGPGLLPGPIVDADGTRIGTHRGLALYTVGQRHGLGIAAGSPVFVLELRPATGELVVGPQALLYRSSLRADLAAWDGAPPTRPRQVLARIRHRHDPAPATVVVSGGVIEVEFAQSQKAITPGQAVVCYEGDRVLGGGIIRG